MVSKFMESSINAKKVYNKKDTLFFKEGENPLKVEKIQTQKVSYKNFLNYSRLSDYTSSNHLSISKSPSESVIYSRINSHKEVERFKEKKYFPSRNSTSISQSSFSLNQSSNLSSPKSSQSYLKVETNHSEPNNSNLVIRNPPVSFNRIKAPQRSVCKLEDCSKKLMISLCDGRGNLLMIDGCKESPRRFLDVVRNEELKNGFITKSLMKKKGNKEKKPSPKKIKMKKLQNLTSKRNDLQPDFICNFSDLNEECESLYGGEKSVRTQMEELGLNKSLLDEDQLNDLTCNHQSTSHVTSSSRNKSFTNHVTTSPHYRGSHDNNKPDKPSDHVASRQMLPASTRRVPVQIICDPITDFTPSWKIRRPLTAPTKYQPCV